MKYLLTLLLYLVFLGNLNAQMFCSHADPTGTRPNWPDPEFLPDPLETKILNIAFYRVCETAGSKLGLLPSEDELITLLNKANEFFLPYKIQFQVVSSDLILDSYQADQDSAYRPFSKSSPEAINVYFVLTLNAYGIVIGHGNNIMMKRKQGHDVFIHEIGHVFGLEHTFERNYGIENIVRVDTEGCLANHKFAGDYISDTDADIEWYDILPDGCGNTDYNRPLHNFMAYVKTPQYIATPQQVRVMHWFIETNKSYPNTTISSDVSAVRFNILDQNSVSFNPVEGVIKYQNQKYVNIHPDDSRYFYFGTKYFLEIPPYKKTIVSNTILNTHLNWDDNFADFKLKKNFIHNATITQITARYKTPITANFTSATLDGAAITSSPFLSDPWFADANGNQDLGLLPVSGSKSVFKDVAYDPAFPLNPYYQIKADAVTSSNGLSLSFQNWVITGAGSINTFQTTIQPIKITTNNATITANYKAMLASKTTGWVGNQFASNNGTSSVVYVSDGKLWLHRENGSDMKEILVSSSISNLQNFSVTANGNNRYWVLNNGTTTLTSGHEINGIMSTSSVPALSGIPSGRIEIVRINSITPKLALIAKIGSLIYRSLGTLEPNNVTWSSWTPIPAIAAPIVVAGNGNVAFVTWIETSSIKGYKLNSDGTWSAQKTITSSSSGSFTSLATAANGSNGLDLLLVRANSQTNKKDLAVSAWNADNTTLPLTVLSTSTTYGDFKAVSLSSNSGLKLASVGVSTYVPNYSYYLWKHDHTSWSQESTPFSTTEQKLFHQEVTFTPSKTTVGTLEVMTQSPVNWGGMTKVTTDASETPVLSISGVQLTDTLIYSAHLDPAMVDSILIDTLGVWTVAVKGDGFVTETVNDLKLFGTSELVVNRDEAGTRREIRFIPDLAKWDVWVVDPSGNKVRMSKSEAEETGGEEIRELVAVYPNPFNPETRITVRLTEAKELKVRVYNLVGQLVADLASGTYERGDYSFRFDGKSLASGTYFYRVEIGNEVKTGKIQLLK